MLPLAVLLIIASINWQWSDPLRGRIIGPGIMTMLPLTAGLTIGYPFFEMVSKRRNQRKILRRFHTALAEITEQQIDGI
jgi:hypothetical protein